MADRKPKAIIYLGGSYPQRGAVEAIRNAGIAVIVIDRNPNAPCRRFASEFVCCDITDGTAVIAEVEWLDRRFEIVGAYGVADYAYNTVGLINERVNSRGARSKIFKRFTNKLVTKTYLEARGIATPSILWRGDNINSVAFDSILDNAGDGVVVKGTDQNNSKGVQLLKKPTPHKVRMAISEALRFSSEAFVEHYVAGTIGNVDGLVIEGTFIPVSTTKRENDSDQEAVCTAMLQPACLWQGYECEVFELAAHVIDALGYRTGPFTIDLIVDTNRDLLVMEVSPHFHCIQNDLLRGSGGAIVAYAEYLAGSETWRDRLKPLPRKYGVCLQKFTDARGKIRCIHGLEKLRDHPLVKDFHLVKDVGDYLQVGPEGKSLMALIWAVANDEGKIQSFVRDVEDMFHVTTG